MLISKKYMMPDKCPGNCKFKNELFYQGNMCSRCPVFNCCGEFKLIEPDDYREDWAKEFEIFFKTQKIPVLYLTRKKE